MKIDAAEALPEDLGPVLSKIAAEVSLRGLSAPAIFFLEMCKPLCGLTAAAAVLGRPVLMVLFGLRAVEIWERIFESRQQIERLIRLIEEGAQREIA